MIERLCAWSSSSTADRMTELALLGMAFLLFVLLTRRLK